MENRLHLLVAKIKELEKELAHEIQKKEEDYSYKIYGKKVTFEALVKQSRLLI